MALRRKVRKVLNHRVTEALVALLIIVSVVLVLAEAWLQRTDPLYWQIRRANDVITLVFVIELFIRYYAERRKERFFRKCWYDILAVLPVFRAVRFLRVLRLLRLYRLGIIATRRLRRFSSAFRVVRVEYVIVGLTILTVVLMGAMSMRVVEGRFNADFATLDQSLWFAVMTLIAAEPVGGAPVTPMGRVVTLAMMLSGLTVFAVFTGTVSAVMIETLRKVRLHGMELDDLYEHVIICGWNQAGPLVVRELMNDARYDHFVIITENEAIENDPVVQEFPDQILTLVGDYTRIDCLKEAGVERAGVALLLADSTMEERSTQDRDARTVLAAMLIEKLNADIYTTVQLLNRDNEASLRRVGVEEIIVSEEYVGNIMATVTRNRGIVSMLDELLTTAYGHQFYRCAIPSEMIGMHIGDAISHLKKEYDATLLAVDLQNGPRINSVKVNPPTDLVLEETHFVYIAAPKPID
ncbi:potassium channel family protein [Persicimonas caeni]|nr:NAD-binding protein [Persicimonas caeni]